LVSHLLQAGQDLLDVDGPPGEEFLKGKTLLRRFRMKRKGCPANFDVVILL